MNEMERIDQQIDIEQKYGKKHVDRKIRDAIEQNPDMAVKIRQGAERLKNWIEGDYYESKNRRLAQLKKLDLEALVFEIFVGIAHVIRPELYTSVVAQMASRLGWDDKGDSIATMGEMLAVLCMTDAFDINKEDRFASLTLISRIPLSEQTLEFIDNVRFLPPVLCTPKELRCNRDSGYLTFNDSLILGQGNHHEGNLCLDVLNLMNQVKLALDTEFLCKVEEDPNTEFTVEKAKEQALEKGKLLSDAEAMERVAKQIENWRNFKKQSYAFYSLIAKCGGTFHLTHKVDKRGRIYAQGYHLNSQGTSFKKAMIEFAEQEVVEGVPAKFRQ